MSLIHCNFKFNDIEEAKVLKDVAEQKIGSLEKFISSPATCEIEFEHIASHKQGKYYRVECNLLVGGTLYRAEETEESFLEALDEVRDELAEELRRAKDKTSTQQKRKRRSFKELFFRRGDS
jgi:ribosomal subunit interface protein